MQPRDSFIQELEQETPNTHRVLSSIPEASWDWRPHEKARTMGQLALHIAQIPGALSQLSLMDVVDTSVIQTDTEQASSLTEVLNTLESSLKTAHEVLAGFDEAAWLANWQLVNGERVLIRTTRGGFLRVALLNHWYHHRGQLTAYLRSVGAFVPGIAGPSADENTFELT